MNSSELYPLIFRRKAVRKFEQERLEDSVLNDVNSQMLNLVPFDEKIKTDVKILNAKEIGGIFAIKAPHYIAFYSDEKEGYLTNAGFMLQQIDLYLSKKGIGSLWLGMGKPQEQLSSHNNLPYVICLAFGRAKEDVHRENISDFKRKPLSEISAVKGANEILEAVRLAPSSTNNQPWYLEGEEDRMIIYSKKLSFVKNTLAPITRRFISIDMGIALYHLKIAADYAGKTVNFVNENISSKKDFDYVTTAFIEDKQIK